VTEQKPREEILRRGEKKKSAWQKAMDRKSRAGPGVKRIKAFKGVGQKKLNAPLKNF